MVKAVVAEEEATVVGVGSLAAGVGRPSVRGFSLVVRVLGFTMAMMIWTGMAMDLVGLGRICMGRPGTVRVVEVRGVEARAAGVRGVEVAKEEEDTLLRERDPSGCRNFNLPVLPAMLHLAGMVLCNMMKEYWQCHLHDNSVQHCTRLLVLCL